MTSNTVEIESHPVNFPSFSVEKRTYKLDPFTIKDGRSVGSDGFVVPKDFPEFHERFPDYVHRWVSKHADRSTPKEDVKDWTQDLLIHLSSLPLTSKYREAGNEDIVQTFDPHKHYGANSARFFNYINLCLGNKFSTMRSSAAEEPAVPPRQPILDRRLGGDGSRSGGRRVLPWALGASEGKMSAARKTARCEASARRVLGLRETRRFKRVVSDGSDCRDRDARCCCRVAGNNESGLLPHSLTSAPVGQVLPDGCAGTETAKTLQETSDHADHLPCPLVRTGMGTGS